MLYMQEEFSRGHGSGQGTQKKIVKSKKEHWRRFQLKRNLMRDVNSLRNTNLGKLQSMQTKGIVRGLSSKNPHTLCEMCQLGNQHSIHSWMSKM